MAEHDGPALARYLMSDNGIALFSLSAEKVAAASVLRSAA